MSSDAPHILIIRFSSLGDVVLTSPVIRFLKQRWPNAVLHYATKSAFADVLQGNTELGRIWTLAPKESIWTLAGRMRNESYDLIVDLHSNIRSRLLSLCWPRAVVFRASKATWARRLFVFWRVRAESLDQHTVDRYLEGLQSKLSGATVPTPHNVLLIQTAFLGDAVLTTPLLEEFARRFPTARLTVVCTPEVADIFSTLPMIHELIVYNKRQKQPLLQIVQQLRGKQFDCAILPHRSFRSVFLAWAARIPVRIGFNRGSGRWLLTHRIPFRWTSHDVNRNLALLQPLGTNVTDVPLALPVSPDAEKSIRLKFETSGVQSGDVVLGINAGSVWATKRWLPESFAAVADHFLELGWKVVFFGGPKDAELNESIVRMMKQKPINWAGQTPIKELVAGIERCDVFLSGDSGPMHIAVGVGVPVVALFGATTQELGFYPYGAGHRVIEKDLACRPCGLHGQRSCPLGHFLCMKLISVDEVIDAIEAQYAGPRGTVVT